MLRISILFALMTSAAITADASTITLRTATGLTIPAGTVNAAATFVTHDNGTITLTLSDLESNPLNEGQLISGFSFTLSSDPAKVLDTTTTPSGNLIAVSGAGVATAAAGPVAGWGLTSSGATLYLKSPGGASQTIIGPGPYTNANKSIAGNRPHNPFLDGTATFTFAVGGVTANTTVTGAAFNFAGVPVSATATPEPATMLLTFGGMGLIGIGMFRKGKQS
jgi:hypothetical protein